MSATTEYKLLSTDEHWAASGDVDATTDWKVYPADRRRTIIVDDGTTSSSSSHDAVTFVRTGGNALQAIRKDLLRNQNMIQVIVPQGTGPGDEILVTCPFGSNRLVSVKIPNGTTAGSVILVKAPSMTPPTLVTGIPVDSLNKHDNPTPSSIVVPGSDIVCENEHHALLWHEPHHDPFQGRGNQQVATSNLDGQEEEEYEMVEKRDIV